MRIKNKTIWHCGGCSLYQAPATKQKNLIKKKDKNAAGTAFAAKPLGDSPFPLRRLIF